MALSAELINLRSAGTYRFEKDLSTISNDTTSFTNLRMIVGFSKVGPFNTPVLVNTQSEFIKLFGNIDRSLEKRGSYFHRSALVALSAGPILCLNLMNISMEKDLVLSKSFSTSTNVKNKKTVSLPLVSMFNTDRFWNYSEESYLNSVKFYLIDETNNIGDENSVDWLDSIIHFTNVGKKPVSILVKKASSYYTKNYELTLNEWYGEENVPEYLNGTSFASDYMVEVIVVGGDFGAEMKDKKPIQSGDMNDDGVKENIELYYYNQEGGYKRFKSDVVYQPYFNDNGFVRTTSSPNAKKDNNLNYFLNLPSVNIIAKYVGSLIPDFIDKLGKNIWIQKMVNDDTATTGVMCVEDVGKIEGVEANDDGVINEAIDIIGHNIFSQLQKTKTVSTDMLSYKFDLSDNCQKVYFTVESNDNTTRTMDFPMLSIMSREAAIVPDTSNSDSDSDSDSDSETSNSDNDTSNSTDTVIYVRNISQDEDDITKKCPYVWENEKNTDDKIYSDFDAISSSNTSPTFYMDAEGNNEYTEGAFEKVEGELPVRSCYRFYDKEYIFYVSKVKNKENPSEITLSTPVTIKDNECVVSESAGILQGDYLLSYYNGNGDETEDSFSRLTRVIKTSAVYAYDDLGEKITKYIKVTCADKICKNAWSTNNDAIVKVRNFDDVCNNLQWYCLTGFNIREEIMPNGTNERQNYILDMIRETPEVSTVSNLFKGLIDRDYIQWRYLVDSFGLGLEEDCKKVYTQLCQARKSALAIVNCPSQIDFKKSVDPSFTNKFGSVEVEYIANGGNPEKNPVFLFSLPDEEDGASYGAYYYPYLRISDLGAIKSVPPAAYVSNLYIQKYGRANAWSIVAGQKRGVISGNQVVGVEATLIHENRDYLEPVGINSIIWENGVGVEIYANKTAKQTPKSALSSIHVREACIYIQDNVESILRRYVFEYNTAQTRLEIKTLVDEFLEVVKRNSGIYDYRTVMDTSNNTPEVIDNNMGVIDIIIEPVKGLEILVQTLTIMKTGGIAASAFA